MDESQKICISRLLYVHYEHADLHEWAIFAEAFGLVESKAQDDRIYYHGYGRDPIVYIASQSKPGEEPRFRGPGLLARTKEDFDKACKVTGASREDISDRPGGGQMVVLRDPNGFDVEILWDVKDKPVEAEEATRSHVNGQTAYNGAFVKQRTEFKRLKRGPAMVHKVGHFGYMTSNFEATCEWYKSMFNLEVVDTLSSPKDENITFGQFFRLNLGEEYVDHHTLLITREENGSHAHHSSFEVEDIDTQLLGHEWLKSKDYQLVWGVGRHIHGSQVFDYWRDCSDYVVEHYADGDLVNCNTPVSKGQMGKDGAIWGPGVPDFRPRSAINKQQIAIGA
ncbi:hypothetical protein MMC13_006094 [Lambiella insularis]|nr:hypothetical protein [Lambiella insularis]